jgi:hypothetical protein
VQSRFCSLSGSVVRPEEAAVREEQPCHRGDDTRREKPSQRVCLRNVCHDHVLFGLTLPPVTGQLLKQLAVADCSRARAEIAAVETGGVVEAVDVVADRGHEVTKTAPGLSVTHLRLDGSKEGLNWSIVQF